VAGFTGVNAIQWDLTKLDGDRKAADSSFKETRNKLLTRQGEAPCALAQIAQLIELGMKE